MSQPSRKIEDLHPALQPLCRQFVENCKNAGIPVLITCTWRSPEYQAELYAKGRTQAELKAAGVVAIAKPNEKIVTKAKPGKSKHEATLAGKPASRAFDFVPLTASGKADWEAKPSVWAECGLIAVSLGLDWGGTWKGFVDRPHCQLKG